LQLLATLINPFGALLPGACCNPAAPPDTNPTEERRRRFLPPQAATGSASTDVRQKLNPWSFHLFEPLSFDSCVQLIKAAVEGWFAAAEEELL